MPIVRIYCAADLWRAQPENENGDKCRRAIILRSIATLRPSRGPCSGGLMHHKDFRQPQVHTTHLHYNRIYQAVPCILQYSEGEGMNRTREVVLVAPPLCATLRHVSVLALCFSSHRNTGTSSHPSLAVSLTMTTLFLSESRTMEGDVSGGGCGRTTTDVEVEPQDYHRVFEVFY